MSYKGGVIIHWKAYIYRCKAISIDIWICNCVMFLHNDLCRHDYRNVAMIFLLDIVTYCNDLNIFYLKLIHSCKFPQIHSHQTLLRKKMFRYRCTHSKHCVISTKKEKQFYILIYVSNLYTRWMNSKTSKRFTFTHCGYIYCCSSLRFPSMWNIGKPLPPRASITTEGQGQTVPKR